MSTPRPHFYRRIQVNLEIGFWQHHAANVPAGHHQIAGGRHLTLQLNQNLAHFWNAGKEGDLGIHFRCVQVRTDILSVH